MVRAERQHDGVVAGRGLQLEVERAAELLAQREPERAVDAPAVRRVHDELHAAGVVEEALEHEALLGGHHAEHRPPDREVVDDHRGRVGVDAGRLHQPAPGAVGVAGGEEARRPRRAASDTSADSSAVRAGASPSQNGIVGGASPASRTRTTPELDPADLPRVRAEQEDVAGHRLDGPVLVDGADEGVVGLGDHPVVAGLGDRAAGRERGEAGALAAPRSSPLTASWCR